MGDLDVVHLELATSDDELCIRLESQRTFKDLQLQLPAWLNATNAVVGVPAFVEASRWKAVSDGAEPADDDEERLRRNKVAVWEIQQQILHMSETAASLARQQEPEHDYIRPAHIASSTREVKQNSPPMMVAEQSAVNPNHDTSAESAMSAAKVSDGAVLTEMEAIELARHDQELYQRIRTSQLMKDREFKWPDKLCATLRTDGLPVCIEPARRQQLRDGCPSMNQHEDRFVRNHAILKDVLAQREFSVEIKDEFEDDPPQAIDSPLVSETVVTANANARRAAEQMDLNAAKALDLLSPHILDMEYAAADNDLRRCFARMRDLGTSHGLWKLSLRLPPWLYADAVQGVVGYPSQIQPDRQQELRAGHEPKYDIHEHRFVRNLHAMADIVEQIEHQAETIGPIQPDDGVSGYGSPPRRRKSSDGGLGGQHALRDVSARLDDTDDDFRGAGRDDDNQSEPVVLRRSKRLAGKAPVDFETIIRREESRERHEAASPHRMDDPSLWRFPSAEQDDDIIDNVQTIKEASITNQAETLDLSAITPNVGASPNGAEIAKPDTHEKQRKGLSQLADATNDIDLQLRIMKLPLRPRKCRARLPNLLAAAPYHNTSGRPQQIPSERRLALAEGQPARNDDEFRLLRNLVVAKEVQVRADLRLAMIAKKKAERKRKAAAEVASELEQLKIPPWEQYREQYREQDRMQRQQDERRTQSYGKNLQTALEGLEVAGEPLQGPPTSDPASPQSKTFAHSTRSETAEGAAEQLKLTILAPFYQRMQDDFDTISRLREENDGLKVSLLKAQQAPKRKASMSPSVSLDNDDEASKDNYQPLSNLAKDIFNSLDAPAADETIHLCGLAPLQIIATRPRDVLQLAHEKLHTWKFDLVPPQWRRLFEEASLHTVVKLLDQLSSQRPPATKNAKRLKLGLDDGIFENKIAEIVRILDGAVVVAGAPSRKALIEDTFRQLDTLMRFVSTPVASQQIEPRRVQNLDVQAADLHNQIERTGSTWDFDFFQVHLDQSGGPVIIPESFSHWPACRLWQDLSYLKRRTLGGYRVVPVEVGSSYTEENWTQRMMTFNDFAEQFLVPDEPAEIGYLAQHDLFQQIPALKEDIATPDYCHTFPPPPEGAAAETIGLQDVQELEDPLVNAWLGPKGTKTPLHTDPYHNILCQVVGYKYIRLYPPQEVSKLYPVEISEAGVDMRNTSQVDIWPFVSRRNKPEDSSQRLEEMREKFPLFESAEYQEAILAPGECLYIPLGWWHYVESLSTSFSVSFWWN